MYLVTFLVGLGAYQHYCKLHCLLNSALPKCASLNRSVTAFLSRKKMTSFFKEEVHKCSVFKFLYVCYRPMINKEASSRQKRH